MQTIGISRDRGFDPATDQPQWGSEHGPLRFKRIESFSELISTSWALAYANSVRRCRSPITSLPRNGLGASVMAAPPNCSILRIRFWPFFLLRPSFMPSVERRSLGLAIHCWIAFKICRNGRNLVGRLDLIPMPRSCFWFQHHGRRNCAT